MDLARAPCRTARKKGSGYENESVCHGRVHNPGTRVTDYRKITQHYAIAGKEACCSSWKIKPFNYLILQLFGIQMLNEMLHLQDYVLFYILG
jgi:hypothetical protein